MTPAALRREPIAPPVAKCPHCLVPMTLIADGTARCAAGHVFRSSATDELHLRRDRIGHG